MCSDIQSTCIQIELSLFVAIILSVDCSELEQNKCKYCNSVTVYLLVVVITTASVLVIEFSYQCTGSSCNCC